MTGVLILVLLLLSLVFLQAAAIGWLTSGRAALVKEIKKLRSQVEKK